MARSSRAEWVKRVERWRDSGLSAKEFAAETGLKASTLSHWAWQLKLDGRGARRAPVRQRGRKHRGGATQGSSTSAALAPAFVELSHVMEARTQPLELVLAGGVAVRVPVGFDEATLERVLRVLRTAP